MGGTFTSWGALEQALQQEVADATREVIDNSMEVVLCQDLVQIKMRSSAC